MKKICLVLSGLLLLSQVKAGNDSGLEIGYTGKFGDKHRGHVLSGSYELKKVKDWALGLYGEIGSLSRDSKVTKTVTVPVVHYVPTGEFNCWEYVYKEDALGNLVYDEKRPCLEEKVVGQRQEERTVTESDHGYELTFGGQALYDINKNHRVGAKLGANYYNIDKKIYPKATVIYDYNVDNGIRFGVQADKVFYNDETPVMYGGKLSYEF